jgi:hypothetical protein
MLHQTTVDDSTLELLNKLMNDEVLNDFALVGGTALALQLGHRISVDIDLFSQKQFNESELAEYLHANYHLELDFISKNTLKGEIDGVQLDFIAHQYPWIKPIKRENKIRLASFEDIAAMKLNAITGNGTRIKDFIDIAYLSCKIPLRKMLDGYEAKYNANPIIPIKAIAYFDEINFNEPIKMAHGLKLNWEKIAKRLKSMQDYPSKIFQDLK